MREVLRVAGVTAHVLQANARCLPLPDSSVDLIVTSPPYFALRSYTDGGKHYAGQVGGEPTPQEFIDSLIAVTGECMRVLKPSGSMFVNLGDSYYSGKGAPGKTSRDGKSKGRSNRREARSPLDYGLDHPHKSLMLLPERYRIACIDRLGLTVRAVIVWNKPNGLPESVTDRVRRSHEDWVHLTKQPRYYSAIDDIREDYAPGTAERYAYGYKPAAAVTAGQSANGPTRADGGGPTSTNVLGKLPGSVWTISTAPLRLPDHLGVDHFAAFPPEWPKRIISGWSPREVCSACGEGRRPVVATVALDPSRPQARRAQQLAEKAGLTEDHSAALLSVGVSDTGRGAATQSGTGKNTPAVYALAADARAVLGGYAREYLLRRPTGFRAVCACPDTTAPSTPGIVLDPFGGTGTTALVADCLGRTGISVDLSHDYGRVARWRTNDPAERARVLKVEKPERQIDGQEDLFGGAL